MPNDSPQTVVVDPTDGDQIAYISPFLKRPLFRVSCFS